MKVQELTPVFVEFIPEIMEEGKLYVSIPYHTASHLCACGCNELTVTPILSEGVKWGWTMQVNNGKVTLRPSIGNFQIPCKSHYWITENKIVPI